MKRIILALAVLIAMPALAGRSGGGTYTPPSGNPVVPNTTITSTWANSTINDIGTALTDSLSRSGKGSMQAPLLLTNGSAANPSLSFAASPSSGLYRAAADQLCISISGGTSSECWTGSTQTINNNVGISGTLSVGGATSLASTLGVTGTSIFTGKVGTGGRSPVSFQMETNDPTATNDGVIRIGLSNPLMLLSGIGMTQGLGFNLSSVSSAPTYVTTAAGGLLVMSSGDLVYSSTPSGTAATTATMTERLRIANTGAITTTGSMTTTSSMSAASYGAVNASSLNVGSGGSVSKIIRGSFTGVITATASTTVILTMTCTGARPGDPAIFANTYDSAHASGSIAGVYMQTTCSVSTNDLCDYAVSDSNNFPVTQALPSNTYNCTVFH